MTEQTVALTLSAQNLYRNYGDHVAVQNVSIQLKRGEVLGLLGPNGAGKTTTMRMLTGNLAPSAGSVSRMANTINWVRIDNFENLELAKQLPPQSTQLL